MLGRIFSKLKEQKAYTALEATIVSSVLVVVLGATYGLLDVTYLMDRQAEDGFAAQEEGRQVLSAMAKEIRPAQNMNAPDVPILYADPKGTFFDVRVDTDDDEVPEIVRFALDQTNKQIKMYVDSMDTTGTDAGKYNYQIEDGNPDGTYIDFYSSGNWDSVEVLADRIVNAPAAGSWSAQNSATEPEKDFRLFTFYGDNFSVPLDTVSLGSVWYSYVRGVKIFIRSDIQPAEIPSPFGIQTNVHLRNIASE